MELGIRKKTMAMSVSAILFRFILLCGFVAGVGFGLRQIKRTASDVIRFFNKKPSSYESVQGLILTPLKEDTIYIGRQVHRLCLVSNHLKRIAIIDLPDNNRTSYIRLSPNMDWVAERQFKESVPAYYAIQSVWFDLAASSILGVFLVFFGLVFLIAFVSPFQ